MNRTIDLNKSVYEICGEYPEVRDILAALGFRDITKPMTLNTVGKLMTIPRGASMRGIALSGVIDALRENGFETENAVPGENAESTAPQAAAGSAAGDDDSRTALLKDYVSRLSRGDSLEQVREDFVKNFQSVDAAEIAKAEQELISGGTPVLEVQRLCDVHSALFHGATREEQIANAEKAVQASAEKKAGSAAASEYSQVPGHPAAVFAAENSAISAMIDKIKSSAASGADESVISEGLNALHAVTVHYAKKGDLIYPILKTRYGISGPADVMWGVDDEIREELRLLTEAGRSLPHFSERLDRLLTRAEEMVYKEKNILLPLCMQNFTEEDWMRVYYELPEYDGASSGQFSRWDAAEARRGELKRSKASAAGDGDRITLGSGHMTPSQIEAVLNTIPMELSFIDEKDVNRFFNSGKKMFKRPDEAVDREVYSCHPPKYAAMARQIISDLKSGAQDSVDVWLKKGGKPLLVRYMAVRGRDGEYVGTLECVQKMDFAEAHFRETEGN